jgi:hypothetical protein
MGAFFANVHVQAQSEAEAETRALVLSRLQELAKREGLVEAPDGVEATRTIILGPPAGWIAVYDSATEVEPSQVASLARALTQATKGRALAALVHDSSDLFVFLYEGGKRLDEIGGKKRGHPERWGGVIPLERLPALKALCREDLFAEDTLRSIGSLLGIDEGSISTGCAYVEREGGKHEGTTTLRLRPAELPAHERPATGPSRFIARSWSKRTLGAVGESIQLGATVHNAGGASRGVSFILHGPAVEEKLVEPVEAVLSNQQVRSEPRPFEQRTLNNGRAGYVADFTDYAIPPSIGLESTPPEGVSPEEWMKKLQRDGVDPIRNLKRSMTSDIFGSAKVRGVRAGTAVIYLSFVPIESREGQFHFGQEVAVIAPPRVPLRGVRVESHALAVLGTHDVLVALAVSTLPFPEAAEIAATVIEQWAEAWGEGELTGAIFFDSTGAQTRKPKTARLPTKDFAASGAWRKLRAAMATERRVSARERGHSGNGFEFGGSIGKMISLADPDLPTLQLIIDLRSRANGEELCQMARTVIDDFVVRAQCAQAFVARWGSAGSVESTPYEGVCGVSGQCTLQRSWQTRFLRAVSAEGIWLGPSLVARVDRAEIDRIAVTEPIGDALRIVLREGCSLDEMERLLAPILPTHQDWRDGIEWKYGRRDAPPGE